MYDQDTFDPSAAENEDVRRPGGIGSLAERFRLMTLRLPETWLLDTVMVLALAGAGFAVWKNWEQVCRVVIDVSATLVYILLALAGILLLLRLVLPRRLFRR